jgi:hypothetical protein
MSRIYDVIKDFVGPGDMNDGTVDAISKSPYIVIAVWRYKYPATFSRASGSSFSNLASDATALKDTALIIVDDCISLSVSSNKNSHLNGMEAQLLPNSNYISEIMPGDWVACWMVQNDVSFNKVIESLQKGQPANDFFSGLKFLGRANNVRKSLVQGANGLKISSYTLSANGFTELDASVYYEPYLQTADTGAATAFLRFIGTTINQLIADNELGLDFNKIIKVYLTAIFGTGVPRNKGIEDSQGLQLTNGLDNPNAFVIPGPIASMLGVTQPSKPNGLFSFTDILEVLYGIQKYGLSQQISIQDKNEQPSVGAGALFNPDKIPDDANTRFRYTATPMLGTYLPSPPQFTGAHTPWSLLYQFSNPTINEMYTCMRVNPQGSILPTLVIRQLPFSSGILSKEYFPEEPESLLDLNFNDWKTATLDNPNSQRAITPFSNAGNKTDAVYSNNTNQVSPQVKQSRTVEITRFIELPRWKIHPILVSTFDVGRSDALRCNFLHITGDAGQGGMSPTDQLIRFPPKQDALDIMRQGLRPMRPTVSCAPVDLISKTSDDWMYILSDILFGQHLTLTGTMNLAGIQSPIVPGDNIEFDNSIFHIESVNHRFTMNPQGMKVFTTSLTLSHGVRAEQLDSGDLSLYQAISGGDFQRYEAGKTSDNTNEDTETIPVGSKK